MISWSNKAASLPCYTGIVCDVPKVNKECVLCLPFLFCTADHSHSLMMQAVVFSSNGRYHNLSRIDPATISTGVRSSSYFHAVGGGTPYVFTSLILVNACHLDDPRTSSAGKTQKLIEGACIEGEWERLVGCIGQIIHAREFKGQFQAGNLSFTTAFASAGNRAFIILFFILHLYFFLFIQNLRLLPPPLVVALGLPVLSHVVPVVIVVPVFLVATTWVGFVFISVMFPGHGLTTDASPYLRCQIQRRFPQAAHRPRQHVPLQPGTSNWIGCRRCVHC